MPKCKDCGQPMLPKGAAKRPNEYDHARGCPSDPRNSAKFGAGYERLRDGISQPPDEIERLRKVEAAAREFLDAYDIGHEEEHMFVDALRKALGGKDGE